jgi:hypothetical protein
MSLNKCKGLWVLLCMAGTTWAAGPPQTSAPLATSDHESGTGRAEVLEQKRTTGGMLMLQVAIANTGREPMSMARDYVDPKSSDFSSVSGIVLIDAVNKKKYFVVRDAANNCVCSEGLKDVKPGGRVVVWARFPSPPDGVQKLSVMIPHFTPMDDVAIGK